MGYLKMYVFFLASVLLSANCVKEEFENDKIVPDFLDEAPMNPLDVMYSKTNTKIEYGNTIRPADGVDVPELYWEADDKALYTLIFVNIDSPAKIAPVFISWKLWLVTNIPGNRVSDGDISANYAPPTPFKKTGLHRYVFLIYKQPGRITTTEPYLATTDVERIFFSARDFAKEHDLGAPVAGNYFWAKHDLDD